MKSLTRVFESLGIGNRFFDAILSIVNLDRAPQKDVRAMKRFLFLQYDTALGSALNATPVYEALRHAIPDAHIAVAANGIGYLVCKSNPFIDEIFETPSPLTQFPKTLVYFLRHMRAWRKKFDCVITDSFNRSARQTVLQIASGVPVRAGYANRTKWVHHPLAMSNDHEVRIRTSVIQNNLRILDLLGLPNHCEEPRMFITESELQAGARILDAASGPGPLVVFVPQGSGGQPVDWFEDRFAQTTDRLHDRFQTRSVFVGT
jgi:ADP-heptose:LPS heptosyltransferase